MLKSKIKNETKKTKRRFLISTFLMLFCFAAIEAQDVSAQAVSQLSIGQRVYFSGNYYKVANPATGMLVPERDLGKSQYHTTWLNYNRGYANSLIKPKIDSWYASEFTADEKALMSKPAMAPDNSEMEMIRMRGLLPVIDTNVKYYTSTMGWVSYDYGTNYYVYAYSGSSFWDSYNGKLSVWAGPGADVIIEQTFEHVLPAIWLIPSTNMAIDGSGVAGLAPADSTPPTITLSPNISGATNSDVTVNASVTDTSGVSVKKWAAGSQSVSYFASGGTNLGSSFVVSTNGVYTVFAKDSLGNQTVKTITISNIDKALPTGSLSQNPVGSAPTNGDVTITAVGADSGSAGFYRIKKPDGVYANAASTNFVVSANGTYTFVFEDYAGNSFSSSIAINNIDKVLPSGTITQNPTGSKVSGNVTLSVNATDSGSGILRIKNPDGSFTSGATASYIVSLNGTYSFELEDKAGNKKTVSHTVTNINENKPTITFSGVADSAIRKIFQFTLNTNDADVADAITFNLSAGRAPGQSDYNAYLSSITGNKKGANSIAFDLNSFPASELVWNNTTERYEKTIYLRGSVTDGTDTVTVNSQFTIFNNNPFNNKLFVDSVGYRTANANFDLSSYFNDPDGHGLTYVVSSSDVSKVAANVNGKNLTLLPKGVGESTVTVKATDGVGGSNSKTFLYTVKNYVPVLVVNEVKTGLVGENDIVSISGKVTDQENDSIVVKVTLGGKTETVTVPNGNGEWELKFKGSNLEEGVFNSVIVTADDSYDVVTKTHTFSDLTIDNTMPFFWAITHTPTLPTSGEVAIQVNVGDSFTGIKQLINPNGTSTSKVNSVYKVTENGDYEFTVEDKAGNKYHQVVSISNIDSVLPVASAVTLHQKDSDNFKVTVKATDESGIGEVRLNNGQKLTKDEKNDIYQIDNLTTMPTHLNILDKAGNESGNISFLSMPKISLGDYRATSTIRKDIKGVVDGSDSLSYQIGTKKFTCTQKPCEIIVTKNTVITAMNTSLDKASIISQTISNIDKKVVNLVLVGERNPSNENEIEFSWDLNLTNPILICTTADGEEKITPISNPFVFVGKNQSYDCKLTGLFEGENIESNTFTISPDYTTDVIQPVKSDSYQKKPIQMNTFVEKNVTGQTYYINFKKNNTEEDVPIPDALIK